MAWYTTGSVAVSNGNATIIGSGTSWVANVRKGDMFAGPDGEPYEVAAIVSDTEITLGTPYSGGTASGASYRIVPTTSHDKELVQGVTSLLNKADKEAYSYGARSELVAAQSKEVYAVGAVAFVGHIAYRYSGTAGRIPDLPGWLPYGDETPDHYGADASGATDSTAAVQAWAVSPSKRKRSTGSYRVNQESVISVAGAVLDLTGSTFTLTATGNASIFRISAEGVSIRGGTLEGPYTGAPITSMNSTFVDGEGNGAIRVVRPYDNRMAELTIDKTEITGFGDYCVFAENVDHLTVTRTHLHDSGYNGVRCYGCRFAKINFNHIHHIQGAVGVGADPYWNQYGVTFTRRYAEPATGDPLVINPPSADCEANFNHVHDFHTWKALDTHGGKRCNFIGNYGTNIHIGVGIDKGHTSGTTFVSPAENILVALNRFSKGSIETGGTHRPKAVSVFGPADAVSKEIMIVENEFSGFGGSAHGAVSLSGAHGVTIKGNKFIASDYAAINTLGGFTQEVIIEGNEFIGMVPNSLAAIAIQGDTAKAKIGKNYHFSGGEPTYLGVSIVSQISGYWVDLDHQESQDTATSLYGGGFSSRIRNGNLWTVPFQGNGSPEGVVTAQRGMTYIRRDGTSGAAFYVKQNNAENTGWVAK